MARPPPGPQQKTFYITSITLCVLALCLSCWRVSFSYRRRGAIGLEDWLILCSLALLILNTVIGCISTREGFGLHKSDIPAHGGDVAAALMWFWLFQIFYKINILANKLAFIFFYIRLFTYQRFRRVCYASAVFVILGTIAFVAATLAQCDPVDFNWKKDIKGHCINNSAFRWSWAAFNTATDLWIFFLPVTSIMRLQMSMANKIGTTAIFALGLFTCATSALRMQALVGSTTATDPTYGSMPAFIWSVVEAAIGLICACLPSLKHVFSRLFRRAPSSSNVKSSERHTGTSQNVPSHKTPIPAFGLSNQSSRHNFVRHPWNNSINVLHEDRDSLISMGDVLKDQKGTNAAITVKKEVHVSSINPARHGSNDSMFDDWLAKPSSTL